MNQHPHRTPPASPSLRGGIRRGFSSFLFLFSFFILFLLTSCASLPKKKDVMASINNVNTHWQATNKAEVRPFWDNAAYHTGNLEAYKLTGNSDYLDYTVRWAEHNDYRGAGSNNPQEWRYDYGENDKHVLFGDWQICFQVYADLYAMEPDEHKIARAREVMEYEMSTRNIDYWWWADGLYMVMPVMTRLHRITANPLYLEKLYTYFQYAKSIMYDEDSGLFYRDAKYVFPKHTSQNGGKDFWARGDGWVLAALLACSPTCPPTTPTATSTSTSTPAWPRPSGRVSNPRATGRAASSTPPMPRAPRRAARPSSPTACCGESITATSTRRSTCPACSVHGTT